MFSEERDDCCLMTIYHIYNVFLVLVGSPMLICMYVCMSENLYPARLKQKSHSRAAVSNKQKRLQCPFEPFSGQVGWVQRGRETVPDPSSSDSDLRVKSKLTPVSRLSPHRWY